MAREMKSHLVELYPYKSSYHEYDILMAMIYYSFYIITLQYHNIMQYYIAMLWRFYVEISAIACSSVLAAGPHSITITSLSMFF